MTTSGSETRVAVVTGGGSGIGRMTATALAGSAFAVVVAGRRVDAINESVAEIEAQCGRAVAVATDVTDENSVVALFDQVRSSFGRVDLLFNNAGIAPRQSPVDEMTAVDWNRVVATNLTGAFLCTREAFRMMRSQDPKGGRIINNGSVSAHVPRPFSVAYTATKHGITGLTKATALDGRPHRIVCGQIDIGNAATDMTAAMTRGVPQADGTTRAEPTMAADDVARAIVYMSSLPLEANVQFMTVVASGMPFIGRG